VSGYTLESDSAVDADIEAASEWYEGEEPGLGLEFLEELRSVYQGILDGPFKYQGLRSGIRRALTKRFPYAIYYSIEGEVIVIVAVLIPRAIPLNGNVGLK
jgi:plasmid stabilization system protein ParE